MADIVPNIIEGTLVISDKYNVNSGTFSIDATPLFTEIGSEYSLSFPNLQNIKKITKFQYDTLGLTENRYLLQYYRVSRDDNSWTEWLDLKRIIDNFPKIDPRDPLYLEIKWVR